MASLPLTLVRPSLVAIYAQISNSQPLSGNLAGPHGSRMFVFLLPRRSVERLGPSRRRIWVSDRSGSSGSSTCGGTVFDLQASWGIGERGGNPSWIVGDHFPQGLRNPGLMLAEDPGL